MNRYSYRVPDYSGLAKGIAQGISGYQERKAQEEERKRLVEGKFIEDIATQALLASMEDDLTGMRTGVFRMARQMEEKGMDSSPLLNLVDIQDKDEMSLGLTQFASRGEEARKHLLNRNMGRNSQSSRSTYQPITLVNPDTKEKMLVAPSVDKVTGETYLEPYKIPDGFQVATETPEEKRQADVLSNIDELTQKLQTQIDLEPELEAKKKLAEDAVKKADQLFEQVDTISVNMANLREARQAVMDGAGTGPLQSMWPSFKSASIRLDNLQGRLGLDVVSATTFGALSKGELDLSKDTALPLKLEEPELIDWLDRRIEAQARKQQYLTRQATFLSETNAQGRQNTKADWAKAEKAALKEALDYFNATEEDIKETMAANNMDRSQVLVELRRRYENDRP